MKIYAQIKSTCNNKNAEQPRFHSMTARTELKQDDTMENWKIV